MHIYMYMYYNTVLYCYIWHIIMYILYMHKDIKYLAVSLILLSLSLLPSYIPDVDI